MALRPRTEGVTGWRNSRCRRRLTGWAATLSPERAGLRQGKLGAGFSPHRSVRGSPPKTSLPRRQPAEKSSLRASEEPPNLRGVARWCPGCQVDSRSRNCIVQGGSVKPWPALRNPRHRGLLTFVKFLFFFKLLSLHPTCQTNGEGGHHFLQWSQHPCPRFPLRGPQQTALIGPGIIFQDSNPG